MRRISTLLLRLHLSCAIALVVATLALPALASAAEDPPTVAVRAEPQALVVEPATGLDELVGLDGLALTVAGRDGLRRTIELGAGGGAFDVSELADGVYKWELRALAAPRTRRDLDRRPADRAAPRAIVSSGAFAIRGGSILDPRRPEPAAPARAGVGAGAGEPTTLAEELYTNTDLYVHDSACIGGDCPTSGLSFGFDTVRLKENNLRIHFEDTSTSQNYAGQDWRLVANDSQQGGLNRFSLEAVGVATPLTVEAGAGSNALYLDSTGLGLGTGSPAKQLHLADGDTPTVRLDQDGSIYPKQVWDVAANEANFFVRDAGSGGGTTLPFRIFTGADANSLTIQSDGDVGIGTSSVDADVRLQIQASTSTNFGGLRVENSGSGNVQTQFASTAGGWEWRQTFRSGDLIFDSQEDGANELELTTGGVLTVTSVVQTSDRELKENFAPVAGEEILERLAALPIERWNFREDAADTPHLGPTAQDFHAAFGLGADDRHIAAIDADGVALAAIQALNQRLLAVVDRLESKNLALEARLAALEACEP